MALFGRKKALTASALRVQTVQSRSSSLVAAAARLNLADRPEAARQMRLRQGWQLNAWAYRDSIGELRYALNFLANCAARMRVFPAAYPLGGESDNPVALGELDEQVPAEVITACAQAMTALGNGKLAISHVMHSLSTNMNVAGECFLIGETDPQTGEDDWSIRSISEIQIKDERYYLRELPSDNQGIFGARELDPELTVISRIWRPHPQWKLWADSPLRAIQDDLETLLIIRRGWRADGRSRLAGAGILAIPEELELKAPSGDNEDPEADDFIGQLAEAMMMPLDNEGAASAVVPIVVRGPGEHLKNMTHLTLGQQFDPLAVELAEKLTGIIATGLDIPKEVVTGTADLNHWSAWQVDDNTFRHHVEPDVIHDCDCLTGAFLRPYLEAEGIDPAWVDRLLFWYDPTELVTHPDRTKDAEAAYSDMVISAEARRRESGFSEQDAPSIEELEMRRVMDIRALPLNLLMEYASRADPTLVVPPMTGPPQLPGIKPGGGVDVGQAPGAAGAPGAPALPAGPAPASAAPGESAKPVVPGPPPADRPEPSPVTASAAPQNPHARLSRKLTEIDRDLRTRLQTAANAAMLRQLERAGAKLRSKVAKDETLRAKISHRPNERAAAFIGEPALTAAGVSATDLLNGDWSALQQQFHRWTEAAQKQALSVAVAMGVTGDAAAQAEGAQSQARDAGWALLSGALTGLSQTLLYNPDPNTQAGDWGDLNPDMLVPTGTIRAALGIAGGADTASVTAGADGTLSTDGFVGQIGTGDTISGLLSDAGGQTDQWQWDHAGSVQDPFEPHEDLDGVQFASFDDEVLANTGDWPDAAYYTPGDHASCSCDASPLWDFPGNPLNDSSQTDGGE